MEGLGLFKRDQDSVKRSAKGVKQFRQHRIIDLGAQAEQARQLCADAGDRTEPTPRGTQV